ncbi:ArsA family ATPase [Anaeromyxobacter diazotrophicus]|uniref:arsenite-transporting ATPase n=1 Tax=Anaeromyxobacter diazotrophicus TaxID=2590199 RepID=A0A7I9VIW6_9BACT|nr:ArsA-related P-loop ATPase [Anaeromyxobacter diazotrophicus]GEJ56088.1 anion transporter [Anaeromyxobacter diazotrophicus]
MGELSAALQAKRIAVCVGPGGVGKTTLAAALGLGRALAGGKVLVCTIDPARRLANALGLEALGNVESRVPEARLAEAGLHARGQLFAMMLDVKRTWDDLVARHAPDPARRERIYRNRLYQQLSSALAGSQEYMAMEKLYELATERDYDLIVLDTPPTAHALDFLDAPDRILDFLGNDTARTLLAPALSAGRVGLKLFQLGGSYVAKTMARFTGAEVLEDLAEFMATFQGMYGGFKDRAAAVRALLAEPQVGFVLTSSASPRAVDETLFFHERLRAERMPVAGVVANRVTRELWGPGPLPDAVELEAALAAQRVPDGTLASRLARTLAEHELLARADAREVARLFAESSGARVELPRLDTDVHDLAHLARLAAAL